MKTYWFTCPDCGRMASIDEDQARGFVSIECVVNGCGFHETGVVTPLISTGVPTRPEDAPSGEAITYVWEEVLSQ